jgi:hypothetical protein
MEVFQMSDEAAFEVNKKAQFDRSQCSYISISVG